MAEKINVLYQTNSQSRRYGGGYIDSEVIFYSSRTGIRLKRSSSPSTWSWEAKATLEVITEEDIKKIEKVQELSERHTDGKRSCARSANKSTIDFEEFDDLVKRLKSIEGIKVRYAAEGSLREIIERDEINARDNYPFKFTALDVIVRAYFSLENSKQYLSKLYDALKTKDENN